MLKKIKNLSSHPFAMNSAILFGGTMVANVLNYIFHLLIARLVSIEIYGEVESITSLVNIITVPAMTLTFVATKYASHAKADQSPGESLAILKYLNKKIFKYGLPLFVLALFLTPWVKDFINITESWPIIFLWVMMLLSFLASVTGGTLNGWQKFKSSSLAGICGTTTKVISAILLVKLGFELNGVVGGFLLGALASYLAALLSLRFLFKAKAVQEEALPPIDFGSIKKYVVPTFLGTLAINILGNADMVLAKHNLDPLLAGQYGALTIVSKIIFFATGVIATVLFSMSSENNHKKNDSSKIFYYASSLVFLVSFGATIVYFSFPHLVLSLLFGSKYAAASPYLGWFAVLVSLYSFVNLIIQYLLSIHKTRVVYGAIFISLLMLPAIIIFGKDIHAILEIAIATQAASIIWGLFFLSNSQNKKYA